MGRVGGRGEKWLDCETLPISPHHPVVHIRHTIPRVTTTCSILNRLVLVTLLHLVVSYTL